MTQAIPAPVHRHQSPQDVVADASATTSSPGSETPPTAASGQSPGEGPPTLIRCESTADFIAALPRLVGFTAPNSLFVVLFSGARAQGTVRVDLPDSESASELHSYVEALAALVHSAGERHGSSAPAVVITTSLSFAGAGGMPWRELARLLDRPLTRNGKRPREICCVAADGWASLYESSPPRLGHPLIEIESSPARGSDDLPELAELGTFRTVSARERNDVEQELAALDSAPCSSPAKDQQGGHCESEFERARAAISPLFSNSALTARECARLLRELSSSAGWACTFDELVTTASAFHAAGNAPRSAHGRRGHSSRVRSTPESRASTLTSRAALARLTSASERLAFLAPLAARAARPDIIALCALAWWARGLESVAHRQITEALALEPEHEIARLAARVIGTGQFTPSQQWAPTPPADAAVSAGSRAGQQVPTAPPTPPPTPAPTRTRTRTRTPS